MMFELCTATNSEVSLQSTHTFILKKSQSPLNTSRSNNPSPLDVEYQSHLQVPAFNRDRKHYTPAFLNQTALTDIAQHDQHYGDAFLNKTQEECLHSSLLLQPKPTSNFCFVCKEHYADYFKHINHPIHKKNVATSPCEDIIQQLIESEKRKRKIPTSGLKQFRELPRKARKLSQMLTHDSISLHYLKEASTCASNFQPVKVKSSRK